MTGGLLCIAAWVGLSIAGAAPEPEAPWAKVTPEAEREALRLFEQGNIALAEGFNEEAAGAYRKALGHWDHPAIHYNLAMALVNLSSSSPLERHRHLEQALRYGAGPLDPEKFAKAKSLMAGLEVELARLEFTCDEPGAQVTLNGRKDLLACPGSFGEWVLPGDHAVRIEKDGFRPTEKKLALKKGAKVAIPLRLYTEAQWTQHRTPWPQWAPWAVMGAGVAVAVAGGGFQVQAGNETRVYDEAIAACAGLPSDDGFPPCPPEQSMALEPRLAQAAALQGGAIAAYVGGALVLAAGIAFHYFNVPQPYLVDPESGVQVTAAPVLGPGVGGVVLTFGF